MTWFIKSKLLVVVAVFVWATNLAAGPATAQQPDSATINGTIGSPVHGDHTWTLTLQGLSYSYQLAPEQYGNGATMTRVYATSFDLEFQGPDAEELNANVSEPLVNSGLQGLVVQLINFTYYDQGWDEWLDVRDWFIAVTPSDYQQGLSFRSVPFDGLEDGFFAMDTNGYPVFASFTSSRAHTSVYDNRPGSGYNMDIYPFGTVSVSSVDFSLPGDFNRDGAVDAADYVVWRNSPGNFGGDPAGYNTWRTNFGRTSGSGLAASEHPVPEPSSFVLLTLAALALLGRRKNPRI